MSLVILVPVLRRPHRIVPVMESIEAATPEPHRTVFLANDDDHDELEALALAGAEVVRCSWPGGAKGDYARKVNLGYRSTTESLLFLGADDLHFHPHWLERAVARLGIPGVGVVGTNDIGNPRVIAGTTATHSLVTRSYVDEHGTVDGEGVLHEGYPHEYVDTELVETAKVRKAWAFAEDSIVEHLHPHWGKAPTDELYEGQAARMKIGAKVWQRRRRIVARAGR